MIAVVGGSAACGVLTSLRKPGPEIPTVRVVREPVEVKVHALGELRPARTAMIVAPPVAGGTLQIVHIVRTGTIVLQGDVVVEFDPSEQEYNLEQSQSQLEEVDQQIRKTKADQAVRAAQDKVSLLRAQFDVRRAELTVKGNELLSGIEARKNVIALEESRRRLEQLQRDIQSRASSDQADLAVQAASRTKAMLGMKPGRPGGVAGRTKTHAAHLRNGHGCHRFHFAAGGRNRHHEHHAGEHSRAHS